jgi:hypothetical protein
VTDIISFIDRKAELAKRQPPEILPHEFTLHVMSDGTHRFDTGFSGPVIAEYDTNPEVRRRIAHQLENLARMLRDEAEELDPRYGKVVAVLQVQGECQLSLWLTNDVGEGESVEWIRERFEEAKAMVRPRSATEPANAS